MSFNGSGTFLINSAGQPVVTGTVISSTAFNALTNDLATGLSTTITKDGQTSITANIPWGGYKITNLGAGTAATDAAQLQQVQSSTAKLITVTGTDSIIGSLSPALTTYSAGQMFYFVAAGTNTTAVTINIDGLGVKNITHNGNVALEAGDILSGEMIVIVYDGTRFQMVSPANSFSVPVKIANGTASAPTLTNVGDTNTGVYFPAADTVGITTGGTERLRIDSSGNVGIGGTAGATTKLDVLGTLPSSSNTSLGLNVRGTIPSSSTGFALSYQSNTSVENASFTLTNWIHFGAYQGTKGASATVTNQYGFLVDSTLTGATNNFGFYSNIASGSNRWNFYAAGTAANYFAGNTGVGVAPASTIRLRAQGSDSTSSNYALECTNSSNTTTFYVRNDGVILTGAAAASPYNNTTANAANMYVDNTGVLYRSTSSLRYKSDVADATHGLADVLKLRSVTYKGKNDSDTVFGGLIAEEVHDAGLTEFVAYDKEGRPDALHYGNMVALLVKAIQELSARLAALEAK